MTKSWPRIGEIVTIASERNRSLRREKFQSPIKQEEFVIFDSNPDITSVIVPITEGDSILAIKQFRAGANQVLLELPGGNKKDGEDFLKTAERELFEETGYTTKNIIPLSPNGIYFEPVICTQKFYPFLALDCKHVCEPEINTECLEMVKIKFNKWLESINQGIVRDGKSIASTLLSLNHLERL